eukprot:67741-Pelagomonas_calceolata.AAC.1
MQTVSDLGSSQRLLLALQAVGQELKGPRIHKYSFYCYKSIKRLFKKAQARCGTPWDFLLALQAVGIWVE